MSNEEISGNKLIMDFMKIQEKETCYEDGIGWVTRHYKTCNELHCTRACVIKGDSYNMFLEDSKYHFSWDWIMPVIEKIEKKGYFTNILSADNDSSKHTMHIVPLHDKEQYTLWSVSKFEAVWIGAVKFIKAEILNVSPLMNCCVARGKI